MPVTEYRPVHMTKNFTEKLHDPYATLLRLTNNRTNAIQRVPYMNVETYKLKTRLFSTMQGILFVNKICPFSFSTLS